MVFVLTGSVWKELTEAQAQLLRCLFNWTSSPLYAVLPVESSDACLPGLLIVDEWSLNLELEKKTFKISGPMDWLKWLVFQQATTNKERRDPCI